MNAGRRSRQPLSERRNAHAQSRGDTRLQSHQGYQPYIWPVLRSVLLLALLLAAAAVCSERVPTRLEIAISIRSIQFTVAGNSTIPIMQSMPLRSLVVQRYGSIRFSDTDGIGLTPSIAPCQLPVQITVRGASLPRVSSFAITSDKIGNADMGRLDTVYAKAGSHISLSIADSDPKQLSLAVSDPVSPSYAYVPGTFRVQVEQSSISCGDRPPRFADQPSAFAARLPPSDPNIEIDWGPEGRAMFGLSLTDGQLQELLPPGPIHATGVDVTGTHSDDQRVGSTTMTDAAITYPEYPDRRESLHPEDQAILGLLRQCEISQVPTVSSSDRISCRIEGVLDRANSVGGRTTDDLRLTRLEQLTHRKYIETICMLIAGLAFLLQLLSLIHSLSAIGKAGKS